MAESRVGLVKSRVGLVKSRVGLVKSRVGLAKSRGARRRRVFRVSPHGAARSEDATTLLGAKPQS